MYNELYHHGILGQKWGVRRFQNADGTRTDAGKKRERKMSARKEAKTLSDEELNRRVNRMRKEKEYVSLKGDSITKGQNFVENLLIVAATTAVTAVVTEELKSGGKNIVNIGKKFVKSKI